METKLVNAKEKAGTFARTTASTIRDAALTTAKKILDAVILVGVLGTEFLKMFRWLLDMKLTKIWMDFILQAVFLCLLSVLFFNVALVASVAGFVRKATDSASSRHKAMTLLQKTGFDFLHKAISCVSFWVCQSEGEFLKQVPISSFANQANYKNIEGKPASDNNAAVVTEPFVMDVLDKAMSVKQEG